MSAWSSLYKYTGIVRRRVNNQNELGSDSIQAVTVGTYSCSLQLDSSSQAFSDGLTTGENTGKVFLDYDATTKTIDQWCTIEIDGIVYDITGAVDQGGWKEVIALNVRRRV